MRNILRRFVIWYRMTGSHHWQKVGRAALKVAQELGVEYTPEQPKRKPGKLLPPSPPVSGNGSLYEDDRLSIDARVNFNLVMFASQANISIKAFVDDGWIEVFSCHSSGHSRYNYGDWVGELFDIARELDSKDRRAEKTKHQPLERGGFVDSWSHVYMDQSPHKEIILPRGELVKKHGNVQGTPTVKFAMHDAPATEHELLGMVEQAINKGTENE